MKKFVAVLLFSFELGRGRRHWAGQSTPRIRGSRNLSRVPSDLESGSNVPTVS